MTEPGDYSQRLLARPELLVTVEDAADRLAVSRSFLYQILRRGLLPSVTIGRSRRVLVSDLETFVEGLREERQDEQERLAS